jgi:hypothetical protein
MTPEQARRVLSEHLRAPEEALEAIYANGGVTVGGYGFIAGGGYGCGIEIEQAHFLMWLKGYMQGLSHASNGQCQAMMKAINVLLQERDSEVTDEKVPFVNLDETLIVAHTPA